MLSRRRTRRLRMFSQIDRYHRNKMLIKIQCALRQHFARRELDSCIELAAYKHMQAHMSAKQIQSHFRGDLARQQVDRKRLDFFNAATNIQRIFRGHIVQRWQYMKVDATKEYVLKKAEFELNAAKLRSGCTSCEDETEACPCIDKLDESSAYDTPGDKALLMRYLFGSNFVRIEVKVYWSESGLFKAGFVGDYNDRMRLWRIDYDKDDNEWLDLAREQDRVMVVNNNGDWIPFNYYRPRQMINYLEKRRKVEPSHSTWTPPESNEQISSEIWYLVYVCRGALDECYYTQSHESLEKLRREHLVKSLTVSIAKVRYNGVFGFNEMYQFENILKELEEFLQLNLAARAKD